MAGEPAETEPRRSPTAPDTFQPKDEWHYSGGDGGAGTGTSVRTVRTSLTPIVAPADYKSLPTPGGTACSPESLHVVWDGSGIPTTKPCEHCGNVEGNLQIHENSGTSYPHFNVWDNWELVCGKCGVFTYVRTFHEGWEGLGE